MSEIFTLSLVFFIVIVAMLAMFFGYNLKVSKNQFQLNKIIKEEKNNNENQSEEIKNLNERLLKEVETKKDLEHEATKRSLEWSKAFHAAAKEEAERNYKWYQE